jgi:hypothetical protein
MSRTLDQVGETFQVTRERIAQIERHALDHVIGTLEQLGSGAATLTLDRKAATEVIRGGNAGVSVLTMLRTPRLIILGGPGSGKSTLTRYITWALARNEPELPDRLRGALPVQVSTSDLARMLSQAPIDLLDFVLQRAGRFSPVVRRAISEGRLLLIIDGLDEVTDLTLAGKVQKAVNRLLADSSCAGVSLLLTSRLVGFHPEGMLAELPTAKLEPFDRGEIERFLAAWFTQVDGVDALAMTSRLMRRLQRDRRMAELAGSPLLLTVLALLQARDQQLPNERAQLYAAATETLMHSWPVEQRGSELSCDTVPSWLAPLARRAFLSPPERGVPDEEVVEILTASWQSQFGGPRGMARQQTRRRLEALRDDAGLLSVTGRSAEGAQLWDFLHRSFAEYLVARDLADSYISGEHDPIALAHQEAWREVILLLLGELGRRRLELVGPLLDRLATMHSTPWESSLRRDLRLALSVLANDVPCDEAHAQRLIDEALHAWASTAITPLREDLTASLNALGETRYAALLAERAGVLAPTREQRLRIGLMLTGDERNALLTPLLQDADALADSAAIALLSHAPSRPALNYLRRRMPMRTRSSNARARARPARDDPSLAIAQLVRRVGSSDRQLAEQAALILARRNGLNALLAMEELLDLYREPWLEPVLRRLAKAGGSTRERLLQTASTGGPRRFGALLVLRHRHVLEATVIIAQLLNDESPRVRARARELREYDIRAGPPRRVTRRGEAPLPVGDEAHIRSAIAAMLDGELDINRGLDMLGRAQWPKHHEEARALLDRQDPAARRLGARMLRVDFDPLAGEHAARLLDDPDATVRCAAAWTLATHDGTAEALLSRIGRLISDGQPIEGPPLEHAAGRYATPVDAVRSCADVAYRLLEETPGFLDRALAIHGAGPIEEASR